MLKKQINSPADKPNTFEAPRFVYALSKEKKETLESGG